MIELWGDIGFLVFTLSTLVFTILYLTLSRWFKSFVGTIIAVFSVSVVILATFISLRLWGLEPPGVQWIRLVIFWVLGIAMLTSVIGFIQVQFGKRETLRSRLSNRYDDVNK